jgi:hypothetical protein
VAYETAAALRAALEDRLQNEARHTGIASSGYDAGPSSSVSWHGLRLPRQERGC